MNTQIQSLKQNNQELFSICDNIDSYFSHIEHKLKVITSEFTVLSKLNKASLHSYCLDSIQFQSRLYKHYMEHFKIVYNGIQNQIYRDYYKLYKLISRYIHSHITDKKVLMLVENDTFPIYKDLEIFFVYERQTVESIHDTLINIILALNEYCHTKQEFLAEQKKLAQRGYDIENLISSHNYTKEVIEKHIELYYDYLCYFKKYKKKYLNELYLKVTTLYYEIPPIEIMKNMDSGKDLLLDSSNNLLDNNNISNNNNLNNEKFLPTLPPSPNKKKVDEPNITTFINDIEQDGNNSKEHNFLVTPTNSEVSSLNDNSNFSYKDEYDTNLVKIDENVESEKSDQGGESEESEEIISSEKSVNSNLSEENTNFLNEENNNEIKSIANSEENSIQQEISEPPKKKRGRPKKK